MSFHVVILVILIKIVSSSKEPEEKVIESVNYADKQVILLVKESITIRTQFRVKIESKRILWTVSEQEQVQLTWTIYYKDLFFRIHSIYGVLRATGLLFDIWVWYWAANLLLMKEPGKSEKIVSKSKKLSLSCGNGTNKTEIGGSNSAAELLLKNSDRESPPAVWRKWSAFVYLYHTVRLLFTVI